MYSAISSLTFVFPALMLGNLLSHWGCVLPGNYLESRRSCVFVSHNTVPHKNLGRSKERPKASMERGGRRRRLDAILRQVLEREMIERNRRVEAERRVNNVVEEIVNHLRTTRTSTFGRRAERLNIGSYYEILKVSV